LIEALNRPSRAPFGFGDFAEDKDRAQRKGNAKQSYVNQINNHLELANSNSNARIKCARYQGFNTPPST